MESDPEFATELRFHQAALTFGIDPWGHSYIYRIMTDRHTVRIYSIGPNGKTRAAVETTLSRRLISAGLDAQLQTWSDRSGTAKGTELRYPRALLRTPGGVRTLPGGGLPSFAG